MNCFVNQLIKTAKNSITLIDNYIDDTVITLLTAKKENVQVTLLMQQPTKKLELDVQKANTQYPTFVIKKFNLYLRHTKSVQNEFEFKT